MPSSYTRNLGLEKPATGEQAGTWGETANNDYDFLDASIDGNEYLSVTDAGYALGTANGAPAVGRNKVIVWTGSLTQIPTVNITPNTAKKLYIMTHAASGGHAIDFSQGSGGNFRLYPGASAIIYCDGAGGAARVDGALYNPQFGSVLVQGQLAAPTIKLLSTASAASIEFWKDAGPSGAASIGLNPPGGALSNDLIFCTYAPSAWTERMRIRADGYIDFKATLTIYQREMVASNVISAAHTAAAIEIRETNLVTTGQLGIEYSPRISFHWPGRAAAQIGMDSNGILKSMNADGTLGGFQCSTLSVTTVNATTLNGSTATIGTVNATTANVTTLVMAGAISGVSTLGVTTVNATTVNAGTLNGNLVGTWSGYSIGSGATPGGLQAIATDGAGQAYFGWINTVSGDAGAVAAITRVYASFDSFIRYYTLANFAAQLSPLISTATWTQNQNQNGFSLTSGNNIVTIGSPLRFLGNEIASANIAADNINFFLIGGANLVVKFRDNTGLHRRLVTIGSTDLP